MTQNKIQAAESGRQSARARAVRQLREWVASGVLPPGDALPSERDLCGRLGVSLGTAQRALSVLEDQGIIVRHTGRTRTVNAEKISGGDLLQGTILVITDWQETYRANHTTGSGAFVTAGILESLSHAGVAATLFPPRHIGSLQWDTMLMQGPAGVITSEIAGENLYNPLVALQKAKARGIACVKFGDETEFAAFDRVAPDHEQGAYELTRWLLQNGRRRIRQMWNLPIRAVWADGRRRGYERAMKEAGLTPLPSLTAHVGELPGLSNEEQFRAHVESNIGALYTAMQGDEAADALLVLNDAYAGGVASALRTLGREPNRDVWIAGYDDTWEDDYESLFEKTSPMVTINRSTIEIGRLLVQTLNERRTGTLPAEPVMRYVAPRMRVLVERPA